MGIGWDVHEAAFAASAVPTLVTDLAGVVVAVNPAYVAMTGRTREAMVGFGSTNFVHADDLEGLVRGVDALLAGAARIAGRRRHRRGDGTWIEVSIASSLLHRPDGQGPLLLIEVLDHRADIDVDVDAERRSRHLLQPSGDAGCFHDGEGHIVLATAELAALLDLPGDELRGRRLTDPALAPILPGGRPADIDDDPVVQALRSGADTSGTLGLLGGGGRVVWVSIKAGVVPDSAVPARSSLRDITELVDAQEEARRLAAIVEQQLVHRTEHDDLTGLKTRRVVDHQVDAALAERRPVSVVYVDLDDFKAVNDELGHHAGDDLLVAVAARLRQLAGPTSTVARAGGDEFVAVCADPAEAERLTAAVRDASASDGGLARRHGRVLRASAGCAHAVDGDGRAELFARADAAMYVDKRRD